MNSMAWLALFVWVGVPLLALLFGVLLWRRSSTALGKALALTFSVAVLSAPLLVSNAVKAYYDRQVRELCAKDGGVRVYETVRLPAEKFDDLKRKNFVLEYQAKPTDEYYIETAKHHYLEWYLNVYRSHSKVVRRSDGKVLGEYIRYARVGGDLPGPWHHSSFSCSDLAEQPINFETKIFAEGDGQ